MCGECFGVDFREELQIIKFTTLLRKRSDMTHDEFVAYHKNNHAALFKSLPEVQQYVRKYVQGHTLDVALPGAAAAGV